MVTPAFAIKAPIHDLAATGLAFPAQKSMYGGKQVAAGDTIYLFDSENEGGIGLVARGIVVTATPVRRRPGVERQTPRVSITVRVTHRATRRLGRAELKAHAGPVDDGPLAELHFKLYRQATNKVIGLSEAAAAFLDACF